MSSADPTAVEWPAWAFNLRKEAAVGNPDAVRRALDAIPSETPAAERYAFITAALQSASWNTRAAAAELLLAAGGDSLARDGHGRNALCYGAGYEKIGDGAQEKAARALLDASSGGRIAPRRYTVNLRLKKGTGRDDLRRAQEKVAEALLASVGFAPLWALADWAGRGGKGHVWLEPGEARPARACLETVLATLAFGVSLALEAEGGEAAHA